MDFEDPYTDFEDPYTDSLYRIGDARHLPPRPRRRLEPPHDVLVRAVLDAPDDDAPRLVYADWLEENGQAERAAFIRHQIADRARPVRTEPFPDYEQDWPWLGTRGRDLMPSCLRDGPHPRWRFSNLAPDGEFRADLGDANLYCIHRGFYLAWERGWASAAAYSSRRWLRHGDGIVAEHPVRRVVLAVSPPLSSSYRAMPESSPPRRLYEAVLEVGANASGGTLAVRSEVPLDPPVPEYVDMLRALGDLLRDRWPGVKFVPWLGGCPFR
jgi:uncharacterized protein (TIGR02996 family)